MKAGELLIGLGITGLGLFLAAQAYALPDAPGYAHVGPRLFPGLIAAGVIACGVLLAREAASGGFRKLPEGERARLDWRGFGWISAGALGHMALIGSIGFIAASTLLFFAAARGFGSVRPLRDVLVAVVLSGVVFVVFTQALGLSLPSGLPAARG